MSITIEDKVKSNINIPLKITKNYCVSPNFSIHLSKNAALNTELNYQGNTVTFFKLLNVL
jgi:aspartyl aminopeptidase